VRASVLRLIGSKGAGGRVWKKTERETPCCVHCRLSNTAPFRIGACSHGSAHALWTQAHRCRLGVQVGALRLHRLAGDFLPLKLRERTMVISPPRPLPPSCVLPMRADRPVLTQLSRSTQQALRRQPAALSPKTRLPRKGLPGA
jgi:hypothetical protein